LPFAQRAKSKVKTSFRQSPKSSQELSQTKQN